MVAVVTALLVMAKEEVVAPAATVVEAGTITALVLLLVSITTAPPAGAGTASATVPVLPAPPVTIAGFSVTVPTAGFTTRVAVFAEPLYVAVTVTAVWVVTGLVVIAKVAKVAPAGTVTEAGSVAAAVLLLARATAAPPTGAAVESVTVPVLPAPAVTVRGFSATEARGGLTTSVTIRDAPL